MFIVDLGRHSRVLVLTTVAAGLAWLNWTAAPSDGSDVAATVQPTSHIQQTDAASATHRIDGPQATLARSVVEEARSDPFYPTAAVPAVTPPTPVAVPSAPPPPAPTAPAHNVVFVGRVDQPDGTVSVYAQVGGVSTALVAGQMLSNGYRVEAISPSGIDLLYPPLGTVARIEIPPPSKFQIH